MTLPLSPALLEAAYSFLLSTPPFKGWKLPPPEAIKFRVMHHLDCRAQHFLDSDGHVIDISARKVGHTSTLLICLSHEIIHVRQKERGLPWSHGEGFRHMARQVAKFHGYDPKEL